GELLRLRRCFRVVLSAEVSAQRSATLGGGPELVPLAEGAVVGQRLCRGHGQLADAGSDVDVGLRAERLEVLLDTCVLRQRLYEGADTGLHHRPHFVLELAELRRREAL